MPPRASSSRSCGPVPDYTTVSRRQAELDLELGLLPAQAPRHLVLDSTGLKVHGAGEWHVRKHRMGSGKRKISQKLHLGVDEFTKEIVAVDLTSSTVHDSHQLPGMLKRTPGDIVQVSGDKAYDSRACCEAICGGQRGSRSRRGAEHA